MYLYFDGENSLLCCYRQFHQRPSEGNWIQIFTLYNFCRNQKRFFFISFFQIFSIFSLLRAQYAVEVFLVNFKIICGIYIARKIFIASFRQEKCRQRSEYANCSKNKERKFGLEFCLEWEKLDEGLKSL